MNSDRRCYLLLIEVVVGIRVITLIKILKLSEVKSRVRSLRLVVSAVMLHYIRPVADSECSTWETLETDPCSPKKTVM
jgi:hypothetical protein